MLTALALVASFATAAAQLEDQPPPPRPDHGVELAVRGGYAIPLGDVVSGVKLSDLVTHGIPLQLDAGYRISPRWFAGVYFQYAPLKVNGCPPGGSCSGYDIKVGAEGQYHFIGQSHALDPWVGLGAGYEIFQTTVESGPNPGTTTGITATTDANGVEFASLSAGFDYRLADSVAVGPFLDFSLGQFSSFHEESANKSLHFWFTLGARFTFDLF